MRIGRGILAIGIAFSVGCAGVAGLDDFAIVACPDGCAADGSSDATTTTSPPTGDSAAGDAEAGQQPLLPGDAALIAPICGANTCPKFDGGACAAEPCVGSPTWTVGEGGGTFEPSGNACAVEGDPTHQVFLAHTLDGGARYEFDLHFDVQNLPSATNATLAVIDFGSEQLLFQVDNGFYRLCNHDACSGGTTFSTPDPRVELYGLAGEGVASGMAFLIVGVPENATCVTGIQITLQTPVTAAPTARVGCLGAGGVSDAGDACEQVFNNVTFSVLNL